MQLRNWQVLDSRKLLIDFQLKVLKKYIKGALNASLTSTIISISLVLGMYNVVHYNHSKIMYSANNFFFFNNLTYFPLMNCFFFGRGLPNFQVSPITSTFSRVLKEKILFDIHLDIRIILYTRYPLDRFEKIVEFLSEDKYLISSRSISSLGVL